MHLLNILNQLQANPAEKKQLIHILNQKCFTKCSSRSFKKSTQLMPSYYSHGKLLISCEYAVLDGAKALHYLLS